MNVVFQPGDVLILEIPGRLTDEAGRSLKRSLLRALDLSNGTKILVLEEGASLKVFTSRDSMT